jgi:2-haloacid dehalogenase
VLSSFEAVVSVDDIKTFKPNPDVYDYLVSRGGSPCGETWLISANPFDVIGAKSAHLRAAWVKRSPEAVFDPWEFEPDIVISDLLELAARLESHGALVTS